MWNHNDFRWTGCPALLSDFFQLEIHIYYEKSTKIKRNHPLWIWQTKIPVPIWNKSTLRSLINEHARLDFFGFFPHHTRNFWLRFYIVVLGIAFFSGLIYFFHILFGLLFPFSLWTSISLFSLDFYFPFLFGLLFSFFLWTFQLRWHFGFLPNFM